jgi:hypothetical protein
MKPPRIRCPGCRRNVELYDESYTTNSNDPYASPTGLWYGHCSGCNIIIHIDARRDDDGRGRFSIALSYDLPEMGDDFNAELRKFLARRWNKRHKPKGH